MATYPNCWDILIANGTKCNNPLTRIISSQIIWFRDFMDMGIMLKIKSSPNRKIR
jgi:hypothetical protein